MVIIRLPFLGVVINPAMQNMLLMVLTMSGQSYPEQLWSTVSGGDGGLVGGVNEIFLTLTSEAAATLSGLAG